MQLIINRDKATFKPPFQVVILDAYDAYYYADIMDNMYPFDTLDNLKLAKKLADSIFIEKNYKWESLEEMNKLDAGYDVRIYDSTYSCVYAAHEKYKKNWIGS